MGERDREKVKEGKKKEGANNKEGGGSWEQVFIGWGVWHAPNGSSVYGI